MTRTRFIKLGLLTSSACGATYWYYKPVKVPEAYYAPPLFNWDSIPKPILHRFEEGHDNLLWQVGTKMVVGVAGLLAKAFINASDTKVYGLDKFISIVDDPTRTRGIITVSNHRSVLDDPFLWGVLPLKNFWKVDKMRWVMGAADICYTTVFKSYFFACGKTIPAIRGAGVYQPGVDMAIQTLDRGGWVHMYPEAKVVQQDKMIRFKWGVGRMIMDADHEPIVIPMWHRGMEVAKPLYETKLVHVGKPITVVFGDPVAYSDILGDWKKGILSRQQARIKITQRLYDALEKLELEYK
ncbi:acyltransferase-domain-containing protein [Helicostylum pulchrum]|nr:acyltransferase-domain-containing protein [Helicostylum pulchrum]